MLNDSNEKLASLNTRQAVNLLNCGMASGLIQAFLFNPWDRALYLSIKMDRPFLNFDNFRDPMNGVMQTVIQRAFSGGLYFPLEEIFSNVLHSASFIRPSIDNGNVSTKFLAGMLAGSANGIIMNPFSRVKVGLVVLICYDNMMIFGLIAVSLLGKSYVRKGKFYFSCERDF